MKKILALSVLLAFGVASFSQNIFYTKTGYVWFFSSTPVEDIEAHNKKVVSAFDSKKNILEFKIKMKDFVFEKALMQEHFNENYVESDKHPYAFFNGKIDNIVELKLKDDGTYTAEVSGVLTIHGVDQKVRATGTIEKKDDQLIMKAMFKVKPADYKIKIPRIVVKNIAEVIDVHVDVTLNNVK